MEPDTQDTATRSIVRVAPENIAAVWQQVAPLILPVVEREGTHSVEDVRLRLMQMAAHLWIDIADQTVLSCVITEFMVYPRGVWLHVWITATRPDVPLAQDDYERIIVNFAYHNRCRGLELCGRKGWLRRFPGAKTQNLVLMRIEL